MNKIIALIFLATFALACGSESTNNTNSQGNQPAVKRQTGQPTDANGNPVPGIPDPKNANLTSKTPGATPTPGIPDPKNADITNQKGATPTPGIPDEATRKRMVEELKRKGEGPNKGPANKPADKKKKSPTDRPRKVLMN